MGAHRPAVVLAEEAERGNRLRVGVLPQPARHLTPDFRVPVRGECGEGRAQVRVLQAPGELDDAGEPGIVRPPEQLLQMTHHGGTGLLERARVVRLYRWPEERLLLERRGHED